MCFSWPKVVFRNLWSASVTIKGLHKLEFHKITYSNTTFYLAKLRSLLAIDYGFSLKSIGDIDFVLKFHWLSICRWSKVNVTLCHTVLFRWYCVGPSPIVPSPKVEDRKRRHPIKRRKKVNSRGRFRHFALRCLEITDFAYMQISVILKSHLTRHIKNTCTNCTQISRIFHTRFSHFFILFLRICNNRATMEHHSSWDMVENLRGSSTSILQQRSSRFSKKITDFSLFRSNWHQSWGVNF